MHYVKDIESIIQKEKKHTAIIDCELLSKVYINLIDQKEPVFQFMDKKKNKFYDNNVDSYSKIILSLLRKNYWNTKNL